VKVEFTWRGITFVVRKDANGTTVYRDKAHLGGPWSNVAKTVGNTSLEASFRKALQAAALKL